MAQSSDHDTAHRAAATTVIDPVCGMEVDPETTDLRYDYNERDLLLLRAAVRRAVHRRSEIVPRAGIAARASGAPRGHARLHLPDASGGRQVGPGACPKCGMALEPVADRARRGPNPELVDMTRRFWIGAAAHAAGLRARDGRDAPGRPLQHACSARAVRSWLQLVLATPVVLWAGWPFFERGWASIVNAAASTCSR